MFTVFGRNRFPQRRYNAGVGLRRAGFQPGPSRGRQWPCSCSRRVTSQWEWSSPLQDLPGWV